MMMNQLLSKARPLLTYSRCRLTICFSFYSTVKMINTTVTTSQKKLSEEYVSNIQDFIPKLTSELHKGQCGRVGVVGGSLEYTGAPYFAAFSALKLGADLVFVFCCREAAPVIKSYSPELIVYPFLDDEQVVQRIAPSLNRLHSLVIGPGLGRDPGIFKNVEAIIGYCNSEMKTPLPLIIDADGLFLITQNINLIKEYRGPVILTPNAMEYSRLCQKLNIEETETAKVANSLGVVLLKKGGIDIICNGIHQDLLKLPDNNIILECDSLGSVRRCGGQGDILSGCIAVFVAWYMSFRYKNSVDFQSTFQLNGFPSVQNMTIDARKQIFDKAFYGFSLACVASSVITRYCSYLAYAEHGRSMTASDMISFIHDAFLYIFRE